MARKRGLFIIAVILVLSAMVSTVYADDEQYELMADSILSSRSVFGSLF